MSSDLGYGLGGQHSVKTVSRRLDQLRWVAYKNNQLNQTFATHQDSNRETFSPHKAVELGSYGSANDLARKGNDNNSYHIGPGNTIVQKPEIGAQSRKGKVQRDEKNSDQVFDFFRDLDSKTAIVGAYQTDEESTEDGMNTNNACTR